MKDSNKSFCKICKKNFSHHSSLRKHAKKFHSDQLDVIAPNKIFDRKEKCSTCNKAFSRKSDLKKHVGRDHPNLMGLFTKERSHLCKFCNKSFDQLKLLRIHKIKNHLIKKHIKCGLCDYQSLRKSSVLAHFQDDHAIVMTIENLSFSNFDDFSMWKEQIEIETSSSYVNGHGSYLTGCATNRQYICHRSGQYRRSGNGRRRLKAQGSNKINGFCPAEMRLKILQDGRCEVKYVKTHIGHDLDLTHLALTKSEKKELASKIARKLPFQTILDEVNDSVGVLRSDRKSLIKKKALYNIKQCFKLGKVALSQEKEAQETHISDYEKEFIMDDSYENHEEDNFMDGVVIIDTSTQERADLMTEKEKLKTYLGNLIDSISNNEELNAVQKIVLSIEDALQAKEAHIIQISNNDILSDQDFFFDKR